MSRNRRLGYARTSTGGTDLLIVGAVAAVGGVLLYGGNEVVGAISGTKFVVGNSGPFLVKKVNSAPSVPQQYMKAAAADAFNEMQDAAYAAGILIFAGSAFRSVAEQAVLYSLYLARMKAPPVTAPPGQSNHGSGIAVDIYGSDGHALRYNTPEFSWMQGAGSYYNFSWAEGSKIDEPWHWDYVG